MTPWPINGTQEGTNPPGQSGAGSNGNKVALYTPQSTTTETLPSVWFSLVLWHINQLRSFNAKSYLYIYIKYIGFSLVGFYDISTIVGYLMPNPLYTYKLNIYDLVWLGFMANQPL